MGKKFIGHERRLAEFISIYGKDRKFKGIKNDISLTFDKCLTGYPKVRIVSVIGGSGLRLKESLSLINFYCKKCFRLSNDGSTARLKMLIDKIDVVENEKRIVEFNLGEEKNIFDNENSELEIFKTELDELLKGEEIMISKLKENSEDLENLENELLKEKKLEVEYDREINLLEDDINIAFDEEKIEKTKIFLKEKEHKASRIETKNEEIEKELNVLLKKVTEAEKKIEETEEIERTLKNTNKALESSAISLKKQLDVRKSGQRGNRLKKKFQENTPFKESDIFDDLDIFTPKSDISLLEIENSCKIFF